MGSGHALYRRIKYTPSNAHSNVNNHQFCTYRNQQNFKTPTVLLMVARSLGEGRNGQETLQCQPSNVSQQGTAGRPRSWRIQHIHRIMLPPENY